MTSLRSHVATLGVVAALAFASALAVGAASAATTAAAPSPTASPTVPPAELAASEPLPLPSGCALDPDISIPEALGRRIDDGTELNFIMAVRALTDARLLAASAASEDAQRVRRIDDANLATCSGPTAALVAGRAFVVALTKNDPDLEPSARNALVTRLRHASSALASRIALSAADVDAELAPFGTTLAALTPPPPTPPPHDCRTPSTPAAVVDGIEAEYPVMPRLPAGDVVERIVVAVEANGLPSFVRRVGGDADTTNPFAEPALRAAAASTYRVATVACVPDPEAFLFTYTFDLHPH